MTTPSGIDKNKITDDFQLLDLMLQDASSAKEIYRPGPYWLNKSRSATRELKKNGLSDFRGSSTGIATSFGDNAYIDTRTGYNYGIRTMLLKIYRDIFPFNRLFSSQVNLTQKYYDQVIIYQNEYLKVHPRVKELLSKYKINFDTTRGGCKSYLEVDGIKISHHYLQLLDTIDRVHESIKFTPKTTFLEIGGGFGVNAHLLVELFGVRKIIYLDIPPNLYVGTQYLKSFYGANVIDYRMNKGKKIGFEENDKLEILCITPPQIEEIKGIIDVFYNAHSFVEMPKPIVTNYAKFIQMYLEQQGKGCVSLVSYDGFNLSTTFHPSELPKFFKGIVQDHKYETLKPNRSNYHYVVSI